MENKFAASVPYAINAIYQNKMKKCKIKMASLVDMYDPDFYSLDVLQLNKNNWPHLFQECYQEMLSIIMETEDAVGLTDNVRVELVKAKEDMKKTVREYITKFNKKLSSSANDSSSSIVVQVESDQASVNPQDGKSASKVEGNDDWVKADGHKDSLMTRFPNQCGVNVAVAGINIKDGLPIALASSIAEMLSFRCSATTDVSKDETSHDDDGLFPSDVTAGRPEPEPPPLYQCSQSFHFSPSMHPFI